MYPLAVGHVTHQEFAEPLARRSLSTEYTDQLAELVPPSWRLGRSGIWVHALGPADSDTSVSVSLRNQGFKIHLSAAPHCALRVLDLTVPACIERGADFKTIGDPFLHSLLDSKRQPRGHSGKFMTIYPHNDEEFRELIEYLHRLTRHSGVTGPRILSDRQYKKNPILFYRYGSINPPRRVLIDGTHETFLISPTGELIADERLPYFYLPNWIQDPFNKVTKNGADASELLLAGRYLIEAAIGFSNSGGLYEAVDSHTGNMVIIKEARPWTNCWRPKVRCRDAVSFLRREYSMLKRLHDTGYTPEPLAIVEDSGHYFLVEQRIPAISLRTYWARNDVLLAPYIRHPERVESWMQKFGVIAPGLIRMVLALHQRGVLLGDLSPDNVLIDPDSLKVWVVDLESAIERTGADPELMLYGTKWGTPGFLAPERNERSRLLPQDDFYSIGMILYSGIAAVTSLFELDASAIDRFLNKFTQAGLPSTVGEVIRSLLKGEATTALHLLGEDWTTSEDEKTTE
ncbi:hypothetical protein [Streptomyces sp. NPDC001743]|uniref:class III lanthionine synthetase LanKC N-terminal domain-containing protein n=1 Tax=Streptomyces sp. NPDC001743 TaxID=3154397 RepID=UPI00332EB1EE